ncbi:exosortase/archaeosortase family protein [Nocardia yamanashiensis]|uniref:exosortase/archaeosortase family protein n=1 Tax=Nocardia yamanashiensis TaxID=209247 RepID=UPI001E2C2AF3|nr:exosortase/archaeosortase family protein [Nocardia yamanashiensis]UGT41073.1 exosortase/archaeosortase family protein [Nocardia yamanashiensis]
MTATAEETRAPERHVPWLTVFRLVLVVALTGAAFWNLWAELVEDIGQGSDIGYFFALPVLAAFAATGMALRRGPELPIYDRQTDIIAGLLGLVCTGALIGLLVLRYRYEYEIWHLDLLAAPLFLMSVSILLFGLRPVFRFWPVWLLVLLCVTPMPYRLAVALAGGSYVAKGAVLLVPAAVAAAIGAGRTRGRALAGGVIALVTGALTLFVLWGWYPDASALYYQLIPPMVAVATACAVLYLGYRGWANIRPFDRPLLPHTASPSPSALVTALVATALIALIPHPEQYLVRIADMSSMSIADNPAPPPGWQLLNEREYPWASRFFGPSTSWHRQQWRAASGNPEWDKESRRRRIMVDVIRTQQVRGLEYFPEFTVYMLTQPRVSPPRRIDLGHGVVGRLNTVVDDRHLLSWTWLSWNWEGRDGAERVSLIAADNHLPDAAFPQPNASVTALIQNQAHQVLRGNAVIIDPESDLGDPESEYKDEPMLTAVAREVVRIGAGG